MDMEDVFGLEGEPALVVGGTMVHFPHARGDRRD